MDSVTSYPCRHVCFSWNGVTTFSCSNDDTSYHSSKQLVIYEGTNIIELHVKNRKRCERWNPRTPQDSAGRGIIGIENATGLPQESHAEGTPYYNSHPGEVGPDDPLYWITPGAPPAFPVDENTIGNTMGDTWNYGNTSIRERAWRFTPQGVTNGVNSIWYKVTDTADIPIYWTRDEYTSSTAHHNVDAYLGRQHTDDTKLFDTISLFTSEPGTYKLHYYFQVPVGNTTRTYGTMNELDAYITVGVDTNTATTLTTTTQNIYQGEIASIDITHPDNQIFDTASWVGYRILNGEREQIPASRIIGTDRGKHVTIEPLPLDQYPENKTDTIVMVATATYACGCSGSAEIEMYAHPGPAGIDDVKADDGIVLFPNPTSGLVTIEGTGLESIEVLDLAGRRVKAAECRSDSENMDLSDLPQGTYTLRTVSRNGVSVRRVVKN